MPCSFPRGWDINTGAVTGATAASITVPAIAKVAHVLTAIHAEWTGYSTTALGVAVVQVLVGGVAFGNLSPNWATPSGGNYGVDLVTFDWTGEIAFAPSTALVAAINSVANSIPNGAELLHIQGYDF